MTLANQDARFGQRTLLKVTLPNGDGCCLSGSTDMGFIEVPSIEVPLATADEKVAEDLIDTVAETSGFRMEISVDELDAKTTVVDVEVEVSEVNDLS